MIGSGGSHDHIFEAREFLWAGRRPWTAAGDGSTSVMLFFYRECCSYLVLNRLWSNLFEERASHVLKPIHQEDDHSRVKLIADEDDESKDYINANYIPGFSSSREYIATQRPLKDTVVDFWRMIWEQKSLQIVVLSGLQETGRPKVDLYWPEKLNSPVQYGDIIVKQTSNASLDKYNIRTFQIYKENQPQETRRVQQYFINSWEDYPANLKSEDIIDLVSIVRRDARPAIHGPITVHCSAGVGWTGTFIALDVLMQFVEKHDLNGEVNVFKLVLGMRRNRCMMVQTEVQYVFIHDALKLMIENKIEKMNNEASPVYNNTIFNENVYVNEGCDVEDESLYKNVNNSNRVNTSL